MLGFYKPSKIISVISGLHHSIWFGISNVLPLMIRDKKKYVSKALHLLVAFIQATKQQVDLTLLLYRSEQILQVKEDGQSAAGSLCLPLCCICPVSANLGVTGLTTPPLVVWWGQVWYFHALGGILSAKFWNRMVLVLLEDWKPCVCGVHEKELPTKLSIYWFCSNVQGRIFWPRCLGPVASYVWGKV